MNVNLIALDRDGVSLRVDGRYVRAVTVRGPRPEQMRDNAPAELTAFQLREQYAQELAKLLGVEVESTIERNK